MRRRCLDHIRDITEMVDVAHVVLPVSNGGLFYFALDNPIIILYSDKQLRAREPGLILCVGVSRFNRSVRILHWVLGCGSGDQTILTAR